MESKNIFKKNTCNVQQIAVISKIHNMQWLKTNPPLSGHIRPKTNKGIVNALKEDLQTSELTRESTMSVPNITANDNLSSVNSTNIISMTNSNKHYWDIEGKIDETSVVLGSMESTTDVESNVTHLNQELLILQELEHDEMMSMAIEESLLSLQMKTQIQLEEEETGKEKDATECDLTSVKIKDCISEVNQENIQDNNNNDKLNITSGPDLQISDIQPDTLLSKGADKEDQSVNMCLNMEMMDTLPNLKDSNKISVTNDDAAILTSSMTPKSNNGSQEETKCQVKQSLGKKEVPKVITKSVVSTSTSNKKNNVTLGQSTQSKMKYGIKQSIKNLSTEVVRKTPDKWNQETSQSALNTSKLIRNKSNLQAKKEAVIIKQSPEYTARYDAKNLKENYQNKTLLSAANKQYKTNHFYTSKKEESVSTSKINNHVPKIVHPTFKEVTNCSNSFNSAQSTYKQSLNIIQTLPTHKKILKTSDPANKYKGMEHKMTLKNDKLTEIFTSKEENDNRSGNINELIVDILDKGVSTSSNEVKENNESSITNLANERSIYENANVKQTNTNPFLTDFSNLSISNKLQTNSKDFINVTDNDLSIKNTQLGNVPPTDMSYVYHVSQQNAQQEQIPLHQNFIRYIPDQFITDCSVNTALPKFHFNAPYSNGNVMQLNQYGNMQTVPNVPSDAQLQNCSSPNDLPPSMGNMNTLQYQMPNVLSCSNQNVIQPPSNFCIHPMSQEEQFNLPPYGLNPAYFMNPICICRNDGYPLHPQNWNLPHNYPVTLQNPYHINYNSFCNQHVQSNNMIHKNVARPLQSSSQRQIPYQKDLQSNYEKSMSNPGCYTKNPIPQNNKIYDTKLQVQNTIRNIQESIDFKIEKQDGEFLSDKEGNNNLPMISPKACMFYGSGLSENSNTIRSQIKYGGTTDSVSNCHLQYQKNYESCYNISKVHLSSNVGTNRGRTQPNRPGYKAQY